MKAVILAAGKGTRLRPLTDSCPKPMLPIDGKPLLQYSLNLLKIHGIREIAINLHHLPEVFINYLVSSGDQGLRIKLSVEPGLLGTAGAIKNLQAFLDDRFVVLYGDVLTNINLSELTEQHQRSRSLATLAVHQRKESKGCGFVVFNDGGRVSSFVEKPRNGSAPSPWTNAGVYVMEPDIISHIPDGVEYDFGKDLFPSLISRRERIHASPFSGYLVDIGSPEGYEQAKKDLQEGRFTPC